MMWNLPLSVEIDGISYAIRNKCDYRVVLDTINALNDEELEMKYRIQCALFIFYEDLTGCTDTQKAIDEMTNIISLGEDREDNDEDKPKMMDWNHDFNHIAPPVSRVLGYSVRDAAKYTHWYDFIGAYREIGECSWSTIISIRSKRMKGKTLEKWEREFYEENKKTIDLPHNLTDEEQAWLDSDG